jgi:16S rRNA (cytosine967-C5)-methyltransferase
VNALLRHAARNRSNLAQTIDAYPHYLDQSLFTKHALRHALGPDFSPIHAQDVWRHWNQPPRFYFRVLDRTHPIPEGFIPDGTLPNCWRLTEGAPFPTAWLADHHGMVQDRSSQALLSFNWDRPVRTMLDLCAAPGGKSTGLKLNYPEANLTCIEKHPRKAEKLKTTLEQRKIHASVISADAQTWLQDCSTTFDLIWIDAPCSASGTIQKHPELTWIGELSHIPSLSETQASLLHAALPHISPGGLLIYSVCSWFPQEGMDHQKNILNRYSHLRPATIWSSDFGGSTFNVKPLQWEGEGFQGFALSVG